jgi:hypothetical protein
MSRRAMATVSGGDWGGKGLLVCALVAATGFHCGSSKMPGSSGMMGTGGSAGGAAGSLSSGGQGGGAPTGGAGGKGGAAGASSIGTAGAGGTAAAAGAAGTPAAAGAGDSGGAGGTAGVGGTAGAAGAGGYHPQPCPDGRYTYPNCPGGPCQTNADCVDEPGLPGYKCFHDQLIDSCASASPGRCLPWIGGNCATHTNTCPCFKFYSPSAGDCTAVGGGAQCVGTTTGPTGPNGCYACSFTPQ